MPVTICCYCVWAARAELGNVSPWSVFSAERAPAAITAVSECRLTHATCMTWGHDLCTAAPPSFVCLYSTVSRPAVRLSCGHEI